ncbi:MAG: nickel pincer cofactor biosynthesis protein LarB [Caldisphaera sp.]|uniref:nickel pincer cofactor biosynthesis protein LarB n=1 Tax=Caldisphaera sp. TaxID=2060322 RepID=UPI003D0B4683
MNIKEILEDVKLGKISIEDGLKKLQHLPYEIDIGYAKIDNSRFLTKGFPEVILGNFKKPQQVLEIAKKIFEASGEVVITKASPDLFTFIKQEMPIAKYYYEAKIIYITNKDKKNEGNIIVACAGTSDLPVAEEASVIATIMGSNVCKMYDIGIAGLHRLLSRLDDLKKSNVIIAVAGMEGALPSVIASLIDKPVIAVPTSVGYGSHLGGLTPLFSMLNSCVPGMAVVNIDNGFGAGAIAHMINYIAVNGGVK